MTYLTNEEIENLKSIHPKKRILRYIFLFTGLFIILLGCIFTFMRFDFGITTHRKHLNYYIWLYNYFEILYNSLLYTGEFFNF